MGYSRRFQVRFRFGVAGEGPPPGVGQLAVVRQDGQLGESELGELIGAEVSHPGHVGVEELSEVDGSRLATAARRRSWA